MWCDEFQACKILSGEEIDIEDQQFHSDGGDENHDLCSKDLLVLSSLDIARCQKICDPAMCCFFYDDVGCTRGIDCEYYSFCAAIFDSQSHKEIAGYAEDEDIELILPPSGGQHTPGPSQKEIESACSNNNAIMLFEPAPLQKSCSQLCSNYMCCFEDNYDPASCHEESTCMKYNACKILAPTRDESDDICSIDNIRELDGLTKCEDHCYDYLCCFEEMGCISSISEDCPDFKACEILTNGVLIGTDLSDVTLFDYSKACSEDAIAEKEGRAICADLCEPVR